MKKIIKKPLSFLIKLKFLVLSNTAIFLSFYLNDKLFLVIAVLFFGMFLIEVLLKDDKRIRLSIPKFLQKRTHEKVSYEHAALTTRLSLTLLFPLVFSLIFFTAIILFGASASDTSIFKNLLFEIRRILLSTPIFIGIFIVFVIFDIFSSLRFFKISFRRLFLKSVVGYLMGFTLSIPLIFFIAFIHLNIFSYNFKLHSFEMSDVDSIIQAVGSNDIPPQIINIKDKSFEKTVFEKQDIPLGSFYKSRVAPTVPVVFQTKIEQTSSTFLYDGNLYFTKIDQDTIEKIAPVISKKYVETSLDGKYVKDVPEIDVIGRQEYLKYREDKINDQIDKIKSIYDELTKYLQTQYGEIANANSKIQANENIISSAISSRDNSYNSCMNAGYYTFYYDPGFHRYYTDAQCEAGKASWDSTIAKGQQNISEWKSYISKVNADIASYKEIQDDLVYYIDLVESQKSTTVYELGMFEPENQIKVALDTTNSNALADFFATSVHEYFHYTSYVSEEKILPSFFEEALTEYFARESIKKILNVSTKQGYPAYIDLISKMISDIGEEEMRDIYLTKNFDLLINRLNEKYGETFYQDTKYYFDVLPYLDTESQVKIVNDIMFRIGGDKVNLEDVVSTGSEI